MFFKASGGGIALFYANDSLAREGAARWDSEEQARVCRLIGKAPNCAAGVPRYELKRTQLNVFLNFNLGTPSKRTVNIVERCVTTTAVPA